MADRLGLVPGTSYRVKLDTDDGAFMEFTGIFQGVVIEDGDAVMEFEPSASTARLWTSGTTTSLLSIEEWAP
jgi:hypothetical protein